ncbi:MAG: CHAT domain-containing protein, partial [Pyrinomonadaceae bacterium]
VGLSWAFLMAGCPTILVSQWPVYSIPTADFMVEFHRNLLAANGNDTLAGKAEALQKTAVKVIRDSSKSFFEREPFFWAGFTLVGDGR